jgi:hypothetical protein
MRNHSRSLILLSAFALGVSAYPVLAADESTKTLPDFDALKRHIAQCWNVPAMAEGGLPPTVEIIIHVSPDQRVQTADPSDKARFGADPNYRKAANAAMQAVRSAKCNPLPLVADDYNIWKTIDITFDPRDML